MVNEAGAIGSKIAVDYLIISKNPDLQISDALKIYNPKEIIFDSSNKNYKLKKWKEECESVKQIYYSVADSGAFIADI
jgi:hypothetical protein